MAFKPINSDHSVSAASFQLQFQGGIPADVISAVREHASLWQKTLPAMNFPQVLQVQLGPGATGPTAGELLAGGVEFSFMRPDGTPAWIMRVDGGAVVVECSRYTRWHSVFAQATGYFRDFLRVASGVKPDLTVAKHVLVVIDDFLWYG
ncbi:MAG TPA: hypothetical protein VHA07_13030, partial [Devosia sp.]|nr:hypothetical protein [Devosia sp.]